MYTMAMARANRWGLAIVFHRIENNRRVVYSFQYPDRDWHRGTDLDHQSISVVGAKAPDRLRRRFRHLRIPAHWKLFDFPNRNEISCLDRRRRRARRNYHSRR